MSRSTHALAAGLVAVVVVAAGCSSGDGGASPAVSVLGGEETTTSAAPVAVDLDLTAVADGVIVPRYQAFASGSDGLVAAVEALCASPSPEALAAARAAWHDARAAWRQTRAFGNGPAMDLRTMAAVDFPTSADKVEAVVTGSDPVTADSVSQLGANARGLGAVEQLLFGEGASALVGQAGARRCAYAVAASVLVASAASEVVDAWTAGEEPYREHLRDDPQAATNDLFNELVSVLQGVSDRQLGLALGDTSGEPAPDEADPGPAQRALGDMLDDLDGAVASYDAVLQPAIARQSQDAATRARAQLVAGREALAAIEGPLARAVADDAEALTAAQASLKEAKRTLATEVASLLGLTLSFSDADGDS